MLTKHAGVIKTPAGETIDAYTLSVGSTRVRILTLGGIITHLFAPDGRGGSADIVLGFDDDAQYLKEHPYFGAIIGRYGNRISRGRFTLEGVDYHLATNNGANHLHGGKVGYDKRIWSAEPTDNASSPSLRLQLRDPDGVEGYPATVVVTVTYTLSGDTLRIDYEATSDRATPINLTNHTYFNLHDCGASPVEEHILQLEADSYLQVSGDLIPTGEPIPVKCTAIDFTTAKPIGRDLAAMGGSPAGYDHCLVVRGGETLRRAATVTDPASGRSLECWTTEPAIQFYTGNFLDGTLIGKGGTKYGQWHAFCLETQHYPDSPNHPSYPTTILEPSNPFRSMTEYRLDVKSVLDVR